MMASITGINEKHNSSFPEKSAPQVGVGPDFGPPQTQDLKPEILKSYPDPETLLTLPLEELKKVFVRLEKQCFLCDSFMKKSQLKEEENWHFLHCIGSTLLSQLPTQSPKGTLSINSV